MITFRFNLLNKYINWDTTTDLRPFEENIITFSLKVGSKSFDIIVDK